MTRYIRHGNFVLYSEVASTATDRADFGEARLDVVAAIAPVVEFFQEP